MFCHTFIIAAVQIDFLTCPAENLNIHSINTVDSTENLNEIVRTMQVFAKMVTNHNQMFKTNMYMP